MTASRNGSRTCALVLGGGGVVGVGWQTGLLAGLHEAGVNWAQAEGIVGTSAGALVGALLSSGRDVTDSLGCVAALGSSINAEGLAAGDDAFLSIMREASVLADGQLALRAIGRAANGAKTISEDTYLGLFDILDGTVWPAGFRCTAIDTDTGDLVVWDQNSGASLQDAVASSCAIPMLFPTVTINGRRYMDGGMLSHLNLGAAPRTDVLVVLSCHPLESKGARGGGSLSVSVAPEAELAPLRESRWLIAVEPDFSEIKSSVNMMDPNLASKALGIGTRQAAGIASAINAAWNPASR